MFDQDRPTGKERQLLLTMSTARLSSKGYVVVPTSSDASLRRESADDTVLATGDLIAYDRLHERVYVVYVTNQYNAMDLWLELCSCDFLQLAITNPFNESPITYLVHHWHKQEDEWTCTEEELTAEDFKLVPGTRSKTEVAKP